MLKQRMTHLEVAQGEWEVHRNLRSVDDVARIVFRSFVEGLPGPSLAASHTRCIVSEARTPFWREVAEGSRRGEVDSPYHPVVERKL